MTCSLSKGEKSVSGYPAEKKSLAFWLLAHLSFICGKDWGWGAQAQDWKEQNLWPVWALLPIELKVRVWVFVTGQPSSDLARSIQTKSLVLPRVWLCRPFRCPLRATGLPRGSCASSLFKRPSVDYPVHGGANSRVAGCEGSFSVKENRKRSKSRKPIGL